MSEDNPTAEEAKKMTTFVDICENIGLDLPDMEVFMHLLLGSKPGTMYYLEGKIHLTEDCLKRVDLFEKIYNLLKERFDGDQIKIRSWFLESFEGENYALLEMCNPDIEKGIGKIYRSLAGQN